VHKRDEGTPRWRGPVVWITIPVVFAALFLVLFMGTIGAGKRLYVVHTGSMSPTIPSRSAVIVQEGKYHLGQVISFDDSGQVVTHRFIGVNPDGSLITKGDANKTVDPWRTTRADVIGGVVSAPPQLGYWLTYLKNPAGAASVLLGVCCVALIWSIALSMEDAPWAAAHARKRQRHAASRAQRIPREGGLPDVPGRRRRPRPLAADSHALLGLPPLSEPTTRSLLVG
jgi:signal peptidase I